MMTKHQILQAMRTIAKADRELDAEIAHTFGIYEKSGVHGAYFRAVENASKIADLTLVIKQVTYEPDGDYVCLIIGDRHQITDDVRTCGLPLPAYTASYDAARTLIPDDIKLWTLRRVTGGYAFTMQKKTLDSGAHVSFRNTTTYGSTEALTICAAMLHYALNDFDDATRNFIDQNRYDNGVLRAEMIAKPGNRDGMDAPTWFAHHQNRPLPSDHPEFIRGYVDTVKRLADQQGWTPIWPEPEEKPIDIGFGFDV